MVTDKPKWRRLTISVRVLMLLVLALALGLGWITNKARQQQIAVQAIHDYGGFVHYDYEFVEGAIQPDPTLEPWAPRWLRRRIGEEYFRDVAEVSFAYDKTRGVWFETSRTDDGVLPHLRGMKGLRFLILGDEQATDDGLEHIRGLTNLEWLWMLNAGELTDAGITHLSGLKNLKTLHISNAKMTDDGLPHLTGLAKLEYLSLQGNHFTDEGLEHLRGLTNLKELHVGLGRCEITDEGLVHVKGLVNLEVLDLQRSRVTDRGLDHLKDLPNLREIWISGSGITHEGIERLKTALPSFQTVNWSTTITYPPPAR